MTTEIKYLPFDEELVITLLDKDGQPVDFSTLDDVKILLKVNNKVVLKFKNTGDTQQGWKAWSAGAESNQVKCKVLTTESVQWNFGLLTAEVVMVKANADYPDNKEDIEPNAMVIAELKKTSHG